VPLGSLQDAGCYAPDGGRISFRGVGAPFYVALFVRWRVFCGSHVGLLSVTGMSPSLYHASVPVCVGGGFHLDSKLGPGYSIHRRLICIVQARRIYVNIVANIAYVAE